MPRPCIQRRICAEPACGQFGPSHGGNGQTVIMAVDEFETIRLIDLEGFTQEQCASQMNVARTTVQAIYSSARQKLADCLVNEKELVIQGGDYILCDGTHRGCGCGSCWHESGSCGEKIEEGAAMRIAVTDENGQVFQHFGHTEHFKIYDVADGKVTQAEVVDTNGSGHGALAGFLADRGVNTLICGGIGGGAQQALTEAGIRFYGGVQGDADRAVAQLLEGGLSFDPNVHCDHHAHEHGHEGGSCGSHGCGGHH